jgi:integration host factor subunit beta
MKKSEFSKLIAQQFPNIPEIDIMQGVNLIFEIMRDHLATQKERIEIRGFGSFSLRHRKQRKARNPRTGEKVITKAKHRPHFRAGKELRERVNTDD